MGDVVIMGGIYLYTLKDIFILKGDIFKVTYKRSFLQFFRICLF